MAEQDEKEEKVAQKYRVCHGSDRGKNNQLLYPDNTQRTTKYDPIYYPSLHNFLLKNLWEQFSQNMNRYFLGIAILQLFPDLTPVNPLTTWLPLAVIFGVSAAKEFVDDKGREEQDRETNNTMYEVVVDGKIVKLPSKDIHVGDIVKLYDAEEVPADIVLLQTSNEDSTAYLQTTNLDGETNYNLRLPLRVTNDLSEEDILNFNGVCKCKAPNKHLYKFDSQLWLGPSAGLVEGAAEDRLALSGSQLLQQATTLRNTEYIYGMAVYTGNETKYGCNKGETPLKFTQTDQFINKMTGYLFVFQLILTLVFGIVGDIWLQRNGRYFWYLPYITRFGNDKIKFLHWIVIPLRFLLLNSTIIPISLKVSLDVCKLFYSRYIDWDAELYEPSSDKFAHCNNTAISEELGQVEYILSDKTGTLTQNEMVFQTCSIGSYAKIFPKEKCTGEGGPGSLKDYILHHDEALHFFKCIVLCNSVSPVYTNGELTGYVCSSPDEEALIRAASKMGVEMVSREDDKITISVNGQKEVWTLLVEMEFNSDRKRMSVIVINEEGDHWLYSKGADDIMKNLVADMKTVDQTLDAVEAFARMGLRTLVLGGRPLEADEVKEFTSGLQIAASELEDREKKKFACYDSIELKFDIYGSTAIEDLLQDEVPETIAKLRSANIKIWMLTGDKFTTAQQVAVSCNLYDGNPDHLYPFTQTTNEAVLRQNLSSFESKFEHASEADRHESCVIVKGSSLDVILALEDLKLEFLRFCLQVKTVLCSRVTPSQKAELTEMVKLSAILLGSDSTQEKVTLGIGDGGNDVGMIQKAHVGVGIRGKEGLQAANSADFQVNWFRSLQRLVLVHGRYSVIRTGFVAQYSFYKSFYFCVMQILYGFSNGFSGTTLFNSFCVAGYNALLFFPVITFSMDQDYSIQELLSKPHLYLYTQRRTEFNSKTFFLWIFRAILQGCLTMWLCVHGQEAILYDGGKPAEYDTFGYAPFCVFLWVQSITMTFELHTVRSWNLGVIWGMHFFAIGMTYILNLNMMSSLLPPYSFSQAAKQPVYWLLTLLGVVACYFPVIAIKYMNAAVRKMSDHDKKKYERLE